MLSPYNDLIVKELKELRYTFVPQSNCWRHISTRFNNSQKIVTVTRLQLVDNEIEARLEQYYSFPRDNDTQLIKEDRKNISFVDKDFAKKLRNSV